MPSSFSVVLAATSRDNVMPPFTSSSSITCPLASPFTLVLLGFAATVTTAFLGMGEIWYRALS